MYLCPPVLIDGIVHCALFRFDLDTNLGKMEKTLMQYDQVIAECRNLYERKMKDYGSAWRVLRPSSITDQIFIKAQRIRSIDDKGTQKIQEGTKSEFIGILNYSVMGLIQLELSEDTELNLPVDVALQLYNENVSKAKSLMEDKNHDYGEAWRDMRISSLTDIILMKLWRIKQIEDNKGETFVSEGVDANYLDIINYSAFALIKIMETE
jgi:hypothetical protein